jgi:hypothetical protein
MGSVVQICNMALLRVGGKTISALTDNAREAELCNVFYEQCRDMVLKIHPWSFARRRSILGQLSDPAPTNWTYAFALPVDYLQAVAVVLPGARNPRTDEAIPFQMGVLSGVRALFCDEPEVELDYTCTPEPEFFDVGFSGAVAWLLASELGGPLIGKPDLALAAKQAYFTALREAVISDLNTQSDQEPESEFLAIRGDSVGNFISFRNSI